jgi:hypothetical protein
MKSKLAAFIASVSCATDDELLDEIVQIMEPENFGTKNDLGKAFNDVIGYNPIDYHDTLQLEDIYDELLDEAPYSVRENLIGRKSDIIEKCLSNKEASNEAYLTNSLIITIYEECGWLAKDQMADLNHVMMEAVTDTLEIEDDNEDEDDESSSIEFDDDEFDDWEDDLDESIH